jgi:8-oxo-dGTP diphosphatase
MSDTLPRIGSALLVRDGVNRILLGQRNKDPQRGSWVIPGGKIHAFESIADAGTRELQEETGLTVEVGAHFKVYEIVNPPNEHRIVIYSWATVIEGTPKASDDLSQVRFFSAEELGDIPLTPLVRRVLEDAELLQGRALAVSQHH